MNPSRDVLRLIEIMAALRTPGTGCPWDVVQNFASIAPYTLEEAYEVVDAIARGDLEDLRDELGDLLLQVVFHARMAEEQGAFAFGDVVASIAEKLIRRHPHVFGDAEARAAGEVTGLWARIKAEEHAARASRRGRRPRPAHWKACHRPCPRWRAPKSFRTGPAALASTGTMRTRSWPRYAKRRMR
jgi:ATP diphosphatase